MCRAVQCTTCKKTTWAGCGQHIASVKSGVASRDWCDGSHTPAEVAAAKADRPGFFTRLLKR